MVEDDEGKDFVSGGHEITPCGAQSQLAWLLLRTSAPATFA